jgi:hypothetical protein
MSNFLSKKLRCFIKKLFGKIASPIIHAWMKERNGRES